MKLAYFNDICMISSTIPFYNEAQVSPRDQKQTRIKTD